MMMMMMMMFNELSGCVQEKDQQEFEQKFNEATVLLQDAITRFMDNLSLWRDEWDRLPDSEKSTFCPQPSDETVDPPAAEVMATPSPTVVISSEAAGQLAPSAGESTEAAAVVRQSSAGKPGVASSCSEVECNDDAEDDVDDRSKNKKWNCYTVFIKEGLANFHLTKVRAGYGRVCQQRHQAHRGRFRVDQKFDWVGGSATDRVNCPVCSAEVLCFRVVIPAVRP